MACFAKPETGLGKVPHPSWVDDYEQILETLTCSKPTPELDAPDSDNLLTMSTVGCFQLDCLGGHHGGAKGGLGCCPGHHSHHVQGSCGVASTYF